MAALVAGVQYGLSSHSNFSENKSLIFVKLTDSAQRAIEDFLRNRNKTNQNPTIQFLGNEGQLSFPSTQSSHGSAGFTFSLSGNQDIEGPQGGFECIQQTGPKSLQSLGTLPCKMRIQANDDVYETTRHRMVVAEENNKNKCTRVIKANGPDIGRKVKVKSSGRTIPPPIPNPRHRESTSIPTSSNQSSRSQSSSVQPPAPTTISSSSSSFSSYKPIQNNSNPPPIRNQPEKKFSDIMRRPLRERLIHLLALRPYKRPELYNRITTEGIKERDRSTIATLLKQVAFMRDNTYHLHRHVWNDVQEDWPFYTEQEKTMLKRRKPQNLTPPGSSDGGSSGSGQSPNSTNAGSPQAITAPPPGLMSLKRPGYYQSADGLQTKKPRISHFRKSDSSATTGSGNINVNRDNARTTANGSSGLVSGNGQTVATTGGSMIGSVVSGSGPSGGISENNGWEQRQQQRHQQQQHLQQQQHHQQHQQQHQQQQQQQQHSKQQSQQRERTDYRAERTTNSDVMRGGVYGTSKSCLTPTSDSEDHNTIGLNHNNPHPNPTTVIPGGNSIGNNQFGNDNRTNGNPSYNNNSSINNHHGTNGYANRSSIIGDNNPVVNAVGGNSGMVNFVRGSGPTSGKGSAGAPNGSSIERRDRDDRGSSRNSERDRERARDVEREYERDRESREKKIIASTNSYDEFTNSGNSGNSANNGDTIASPSDSDETDRPNEDTKYPDCLTYYTTITSPEQRRRYKAEFSEDYEEYQALHTEVGRVLEPFTALEAEYRREEREGNDERALAIRNQILKAFVETRNDPIHKEKKKRFDYLHKKLSHLKQLVQEYDAKNLSANEVTSIPEYPDCLTNYTTISSPEQRRSYKAEFSKDYEEYRVLHTEVGRALEPFTALETEYRREEREGNDERALAIRNQIMKAFVEARNDPSHKEKKKRFDYLHKKMSHLKQLIHEYDAKNLSVNGVTGSGGVGNPNENDGTDVGIRVGSRN